MNVDGWIVDFFTRHPLPALLSHIGTALKRIGEGDDLAFLCILFGMYAYLKRDGKALRSSVAAIAALSISGIVVQGLKRLFGRARPRMDLGDYHFIGPNAIWNGFDSFPSGHATSAFTLAAFFSHYYPKGRYYFYAFAASIALLGRVALGDHYLTDVIAGALLGTVAGGFMARKCAPWIESRDASLKSETQSGSGAHFEASAGSLPNFNTAQPGHWVGKIFPEARPALRPHWQSLLIIAAFSGAVLLAGLSRSALWDRDETEYAQSTIEMAQSGDWLIPTLEGEPFIEKPILLYWVTHAGTEIFGRNEIGFRFPSALLGILCCWLTYLIAQSLWGGDAGLKSALILSSSILFTGCFNMLMTDPLFIFFSLLSLWLYILAQKNPERSTAYLAASYVAIGMSALAKGPVAFFPIPVYLLFEYFTREGSAREFVLKNILRCALLSIIPVAIAAPWFLYAFSREKQATSAFFLYDNIFRFLQGMEGHTGPTFYYVIVLAFGFMPWSAFFARAAVQNWRDRASGAPIRADIFLVLTWTLFLFAFFSNSANKLPHYIAPMLPVMACWAGKFWDDQTERPQKLSATFLWTLVLAGLMLMVPIAPFAMKRPHYASLALAAPFLLLFAQLILARRKAGLGDWGRSFLLIALSGVLFLGAAKLWAFPWIERFRVMKPIGLAVRKHVPADAALFGYFVSEPSLFIYGGRTFPKIEDVSLDALLIRPEPTYIIVPETWLKSDISYEILETASGFAENSGEITLHLIRNLAGNKR